MSLVSFWQCCDVVNQMSQSVTQLNFHSPQYVPVIYRICVRSNQGFRALFAPKYDEKFSYYRMHAVMLSYSLLSLFNVVCVYVLNFCHFFYCLIFYLPVVFPPFFLAITCSQNGDSLLRIKQGLQTKLRFPLLPCLQKNTDLFSYRDLISVSFLQE